MIRIINILLYLCMGKLIETDKFDLSLFSKDMFEKRKHVHIESHKGKGKKFAKVWLEPDIEVVKFADFSEKEMNKILKFIENNIDLINKQTDKFISGKKIKIIKL